LVARASRATSYAITEEERKENTMKRRREQAGTIYKKGGVWYLRYSDFRVTDGQLQRKRLAKQLGAVTDMTKQQARDEAKNFLANINKPTLMPETAVKFTEFVESVYFPRVEQRIRPSTYRGYKVLWTSLKPFCADLWTRDVRTRHVQSILDAMARRKGSTVTACSTSRAFCLASSGSRVYWGAPL
jgi:hypothetical protein